MKTLTTGQLEAILFHIQNEQSEALKEINKPGNFDEHDNYASPEKCPEIEYFMGYHAACAHVLQFISEQPKTELR